MKKQAANTPDIETRIFHYIMEHGAQSEADMMFQGGFSKDDLLKHGQAAAARYVQATSFSNAA